MYLIWGLILLCLPLFTISSKFSSQYNKFSSSKWNSAQRVIGILQKSILNGSMLKFCAVLKYYDLNVTKKSTVAGKVSTSFPIDEISSQHSVLIIFILKFYTYKVRGDITQRSFDFQKVHYKVTNFNKKNFVYNLI